MVSARVIGYGAVVAAGLAVLSPSGSACDNRYAQVCGPKPATTVETNQAAKVAKSPVRSAQRKSARVKRSATARRKAATRQATRRSARARHAKWKSEKAADRRKSARAHVKQQKEKADSLASASSQSTGKESVIERRFRGFIAPASMATNVFEVMRRPRLDNSHLAPAATVTSIAMVAPSVNETPAATEAYSPEPETVGSAGYQVASAESVVVSEPPPSPPPAQAVETAKPADTPSDSLPLRELFLALCGALTAASALRFVVGA